MAQHWPKCAQIWTKPFMLHDATMPHKMGLSRWHKRGTGQNTTTAHKREIVRCKNVNGRAGKVSELAPAEPTTDIAQ
jgi:hypothetical protein